MEYWSVYDINRQKTSQIKLKGESFEKGEFHQVVHCSIINEKNELLIQLRHPNKKYWSGLWDITCGGSSLANETSQEAIERELFEELGITIEFKLMRPLFTINFSFGFDDFYVLRKNIDIDHLKLQVYEVKAIKWASKDEIKRMIKDQEFIPYRVEIIDLIFSMGDGLLQPFV